MRIALPGTIDPAAFAGLDPHAPVVDLGGETMGTRWSVRFAVPAGLDPRAAEAAIVARLGALVAEMSHWLPTSLLSRFNRAEGGCWMALPPDFACVMAEALGIAAATGGAFDPAMGALVDLWGFGPPGAMPPPSDEAVAAARRVSGWQRLARDGAALRQPGGLRLDLSGIAKGHAVDAVAAVLGRLGVRHWLVEIGGELAGRGVRPDGQPWWVDLEVPPGVPVAPMRVALHGLAVATSGDYVRGAHTLDPRTGRPVANGVVSASVLHASAMTADGWATALTVLGTGPGIAALAAAGVAGRVVVVEGGEVREHLSPALAMMLAG